jgi:peptide/nickel transport system permease protein
MGNGTTNSSSGGVAERKRCSGLVGFVIRLVKEKPLGAAGGIITLLLLLTGIFADLLAPYGMNETNPAAALLAPSAKYWLGTDNLGRDLLSRIIFGARVSVIVGLTAATMATFLSTVIGIVSGYIGGKFDLTVQRFVDAVLSFPDIVFLMVLISVVGPGMWQVIIAIGIVWGISGSRIVRSAVIGIKENVYVEAAISIGCPTSRMLSRHILPNIMAPIIILFSTMVPSVILTEASLSFLGFGIPPPAPSWGGMLSGIARSHFYAAPWMLWAPGAALSIVVYGINMFGDGMRDLLDPRLRGGVGRYGVLKPEKEVTIKK